MPGVRPRSAYIFHLLARGGFCGVALALLALTAGAEQIAIVPTAHAAGVPYCPNPLVDERAPTRPVIQVNRAEGPVSTQLTFTATGWRSGAHVALHLDGRDPKTGELYVLMPDYAQGTVTGDGAITLSLLQAPSFLCVDITSPVYTSYQFDQSGDETAYFTLVADDGAVSAPLAFRYLPAPIVVVNTGGANAQQVKVGTTITVTGSGWEPYEPLTISLGSADPSTPGAIPHARQTHVTSDSRGIFTVSYLLDARLPWNRDALVTVEGVGPRFGTLDESGYIFLLPAIQPTFRVDQTVVTPGMAITVSGEHWYPGQAFTIKYCAAWLTDHGWDEGPNCGKAVNPALGTVTIGADGRIRQRFTIPADEPLGVIMIRVNNVAGWIGVQPIAVHIVNHLPTWDETHPRVAALRNKVVGSLPFTVPGALLLGALAFVGVRRWRMKQASG